MSSAGLVHACEIDADNGGGVAVELVAAVVGVCEDISKGVCVGVWGVG